MQDAVAVTKKDMSVAERAFGWVGGAMVAVALYLLVFGGGPSDGAALGPPVGLEIMAPVDGAEVNRPLEIVFRTEAPISVQPGGWGTGGYHLHADLSGIEVMPGPQDIRQREDGAYTWVVSGASPGELSVRLLWSDAAHRPVAGGGTDVVRVTVR